MAFTSADLISRVKRIAAIPSAGAGFTDATILGIINEEMDAEIVPFLVKLRGEYLLTYSDTAVNIATEFYTIPTRAVGGALRDVCIVNKDSDALEADDVHVQLERVDPEELPDVTFPAFALRGNKIQIAGIENYSGYYVRQYYWRRPNEMVNSTSAARQVATVGSGSITVATMPSAWSGTVTLDVIDDQPPFELLGEAVSATVSGVTLTGTFPSTIAAGDWVNLTGYSAVAMVPDIVYPLLAQSAALRILETWPDAGGLKVVQDRFARMKNELFDFMSQRVEGAPQSFARSGSVLDVV